MRVNSYDHLNFSRKSVVQFRLSRYVICLNRTCEWKIMTVWISRELLLFNFERLDMLWAWIGHASERLWPFEFLESFRCSISSVSICYAPESDMWVKIYDHSNSSRASVVQFLASWYNMSPNWTSEWKVMTNWISPVLLLFNFERLDMLCTWIGNPSEKLWPFRFLESFRCSISIVSICYAPESYMWVKIYDHLNILRASVFQFERHDMLCTWIGHVSEKLWPFEYLESFRCSISSVSICYAPESDMRVKS